MERRLPEDWRFRIHSVNGFKSLSVTRPDNFTIVFHGRREALAYADGVKEGRELA
jgi:hypothetical protein